MALRNASSTAHRLSPTQPIASRHREELRWIAFAPCLSRPTSSDVVRASTVLSARMRRALQVSSHDGMTLSRRRPTPVNTFSQAEAARRIGVTTARVGQLIEEGSLPGQQVEGYVRKRVLIQDVRRLIRQRELFARLDRDLPTWRRGNRWTGRNDLKN